uniref:Uncharacterized protein n=1 Tax=Setaria digitata TaxID=48799 RepID=A0A915PQE5_9BILA
MIIIKRWFVSLLLLRNSNFGMVDIEENKRGELLNDSTTNYYAHPIRGTVIFVKVIFREECKKFTFFTAYDNQPATPYVIYEKTDKGARLTFGFDYDREPFISLDSKHALYFINGEEKMLMDSNFNSTKPLAYVSGCNPTKQRIIIRQSIYVDPFNWGSYLWISNMRALGSIQSDNTVICSLRYFPAGQGSFMLGAYGQRTRDRIPTQRSFMDILLDETQDEFDLSIAMTLYDSTIRYQVTGSFNTVYQSECSSTQEDISNLCKPNFDDFYFGCLHVGYHLTEERETIPNRTASRCTLVGPSPYRSIIDRSQRLIYTYGYWEDVTLMRMQDEGNSTLIIDNIQMIPSSESEIFDTTTDEFDWF